ncbi:DUF6169 family protein [Phocaeicola sp.]
MNFNIVSVDAINITSPYHVRVQEDERHVLTFTTNHALVYQVSFFLDESLYVKNVYQFVIEEVNDTHSAHDDKVEKTIVAILNSFFQNPECSLAFVCDTKQGYASARNHLFERWFRKYAGSQLIKLDGVIHTDGDMYYTSIITRKDNPNLELLQANYSNYIELLQK